MEHRQAHLLAQFGSQSGLAGSCKVGCLRSEYRYSTAVTWCAGSTHQWGHWWRWRCLCCCSVDRESGGPFEKHRTWFSKARYCLPRCLALRFLALSDQTHSRSGQVSKKAGNWRAKIATNQVSTDHPAPCPSSDWYYLKLKWNRIKMSDKGSSGRGRESSSTNNREKDKLQAREGMKGLIWNRGTGLFCAYSRTRSSANPWPFCCRQRKQAKKEAA